MVIESEIVNWYALNKRELPWRNTKSPYKIWISEVILQQTRVNQALNYYNAFINRFPDVNSLALAKEAEVLKMWQGLGYYSRARNLHQSARFIVNELNGKFPSSYEELINLKGIGNYTAAAIASFAYNEKVPVIDGNVFRVLSRIFAENSPINSSEGKKIFYQLAQELIKSQIPEIFNQAIMEFGALQCMPKNPNCTICPLSSICIAYQKSTVLKFPVKRKADEKKKRFLNYFFIENQEFTYITKREKQDIWKGLFEFPMIESSENQDYGVIFDHQEWKYFFGNIHFIIQSVSENIIHNLSHQKIYARFYHIKTTSEIDLPVNGTNYFKILMDDIKEYPVHKLMENYLNSQECFYIKNSISLR